MCHTNWTNIKQNNENMNNLDKQYTDLLKDILENGTRKSDRTGTGTISVFGRQIRHKMSEGFPLLTTKKMPFKTIVTELLWFLQGRTDLKYLLDNNCHIWDGDAYRNYLNVVMYEKPDYFHEKYGHLSLSVKREGDNYIPYTQEEFINKIKTDDKFANTWGELGPIYGKQWRSWGRSVAKTLYPELQPVDQIANLISELKTNPDSRRLMVNAWNVGELDQMTLPPCHYGFQVYTRELSQTELNILYNKRRGVGEVDTKYTIGTIVAKDPNIQRRAISLMWNQRSVDTFLGLPFNIASYGLLLEIIAKEVNMVPDELIGNLGDVHLYVNHIEQAKEQIGRELSLEERSFIANSNHSEVSQAIKMFTGIDEDSTLHGHLDDIGIPKRTREPFPLPTLKINTEFWKTESGECGVGPLDTKLYGLEISDFSVENYQSHPTIKAPLSN